MTDRPRWVLIAWAVSKLGDGGYHLIFCNCQHKRVQPPAPAGGFSYTGNTIRGSVTKTGNS